MIIHSTSYTPIHLKSNTNENNSEECICFNQDKLKNDASGDEIPKQSQIISDIENSKLPYKEIGVDINDSRLVLRIQKYPAGEQEKRDPSCECIEDALKYSLSASKSKTKINDDNDLDESTTDLPKVAEVILFEAAENDKIQNGKFKLTSKQCNASKANDNSDDNHDMFILKIRRRAETWDRKRENIDLEFRSPKLLM